MRGCVGELVYIDNADDPNRLLFMTAMGHAVQHGNFRRRAFRKTINQLWPEPHRLNALRWHDLRHTHASHLMAATGNLGLVQKRLGHRDIATTYRLYAHMLPQTDASLADAIGAMYAEADAALAAEAAENVVPLPSAKAV